MTLISKTPTKKETIKDQNTISSLMGKHNSDDDEIEIEISDENKRGNSDLASEDFLQEPVMMMMMAAPKTAILRANPN